MAYVIGSVIWTDHDDAKGFRRGYIAAMLKHGVWKEQG